MHSTKFRLLIVFLVALTAVQLGTAKLSTAQIGTSAVSSEELSFEVNRVRTPLSIMKARLEGAQSIVDLHDNYKPSWVREYISVEISATYKGKLRSALSKNDVLSQEQKRIMQTADVGTEINVHVNYIPENTLKGNEPKEINFDFLVNPQVAATYPGGEQQLLSFLKETAIDKVPNDLFVGYALAAVKFSIDENGKVTDAHIVESSKDEATDELLLEAVNSMPNWKPAEYDNGVKTTQEFALTVGNMENCMIHTLNLYRD